MKNKRLIIALSIIALMIWGYNAYSVKEGLTYSKDLVGKKDPQAGKRINGKRKINKCVYNASLRDPFKPPVYKRIVKKKPVKKIVKKKIEMIQLPPISIDGILWDNVNPTAILKNKTSGDVKIVGKGTVWDSVKIIDITKTEVKIRYKKKPFIIK